MKTCIATVIKNEHEYLDEWIQYHLDLGIDHIFIFEDFDSESHSQIIDKYGDVVTLRSIGDILDDYEKSEAIELKQTKRKSVHNIYIKACLKHIKNQYDLYDWCFMTDCDEFITTNGRNLNDILSLYKTCDALVLQWAIYGASGLLKKPDYSLHGVVDTYTEKFDNGIIKNENDLTLCKTCYNMRTFKESNFRNTHRPSNSCRWREIDYRYSFDQHSVIYIRHYITKSWEEYRWKIEERGFMWGLKRNYDFFFNINPDLNYLKDQLTSNKETLVVLPYVQNKSQGNEIRLTLNGWKKYCTFNYHFIVVGEFDESLTKDYPWVEFIHKKSVDWRNDQYVPHLDIMSKFNYIMEKYSHEYNGFIYITDDNYAIKPFTLEDIASIYYFSPSFSGNSETPASYWNHDKWKTRQLLDREGLPSVNYTTHFPYYMEFSKLKEIMDKFNLLEESYVFDDIYFNYFSHCKPIPVSEIRLGVWSSKIFKECFNNAINNPNIKFICNSVEGWSKKLEEELDKLTKI